MKKANYNKCLTLFLSTLFLASCGGGSSGGNEEGGGTIKEDPTKVNIVVGNLDTGFGNKWLEEAASRYEEIHKDDVFGNKKGVKVNINSTSDSVYPRDGSSVLSDNIDVHFRENMNIDALIRSNALEDLSSVLNSKNEYDNNKTIASKISEDDKKLYTLDKKIYAAPCYSGSYGIVYNKTMFYDEKLYISKSTPADATSISEVKFTNRAASYSAGYDGVSGTYDDGLPSTYIEFQALLNEATKKDNIIPIGWSQKYAEGYVTRFLTSAYCSDAGYEQAKLRFSFDGNATNLGTVSGDTFVKDLSPTTITNGKNGNGFEIMRSKANFDALSLYKSIVSNSKYFVNQTDGSNFDHYAMQEYMLKGYYDEKLDNTFRVAMTIDGTWFYNEVMKHAAGLLGDAEFGFMPIPKQTFNGVTDRKYVFTEEGQTCVFVKGNIADEDRKNVALDFVKFFYSDSELLNFAKSTQCVIGVKYPELSKESEDYKALGSFGQDVYNITQNSYRINVNYPNEFLLNNKNELIGDYFFKTSSKPNPIKSLLGATKVGDYFNDMVSYYNSEKWKQLS